MYSKVKFFINKFLSGDHRSVKAKKNIIYSFVIRGFSIIISLILVPMTLGYLNSYEYGIWLTLSSVMLWLDFFDVGLGNGLRNKLAEALAQGNKKLGQIYVSTTFFMLVIIMTLIFILFSIAQNWLDWTNILNVDKSIVPNLNAIVTIVFTFVCISFVFKFIGNVYFASQLPAVNSFFSLIGQVLSLVAIYILTLTTKGSLDKVAYVYSASPAIVLLLSYPVSFFYKYKYLKPTIKGIQFKYLKSLMGLGIQFFIMQIGGVLIFTTSNLIISKMLNPREVTPYNIAFKYFNIVFMLYSIILTPMWSSTTDAFAKGDFDWIKRSMKNMLKIWGGFVGAVILMIFCANCVYKIWVGQNIYVPLQLSLISGIYIIILTWSTCFSTFIFGMGKIRLQLYNTIIMGIIFVPLASFLCKRIGVSGVMLALSIVNIISSILNPIQYYKIVSKRATGVWNK